MLAKNIGRCLLHRGGKKHELGFVAPRRPGVDFAPGDNPMLTLILLVFAFVCFALAAFWQPSPPRFNLIAAGLAFATLTLILGHPR